MRNLLYLVHRLPYPPNKGDKVRSYHLLKHLTRSHRVFLGTFIDDPADAAWLDTVQALCPDLHVARLNPRLAKLRSLGGLLTGQALSLGYYENAELRAWVRGVATTHAIDATVIFSSVMAQFVDGVPELAGVPMLVDFVDVDSAKWTQYAPNHRWPMSWLYQREGERLLAFERSVAVQARRSFFVTDKETALFVQHAPEAAARVEAISNGVDAEFFSPDPTRASPFQTPHTLVFTGAMDYWPNIDAVCWFVQAVLPGILTTWPDLRFYIVGRSPAPAVLALASDAVVVTGTVDDVRPYLQFADVVVAPLRVARGIQNKILEAMAMGRPVVAASHCVEAIDTRSDADLLPATTADDFIKAIAKLLHEPATAKAVGEAGRTCVQQAYSWDAHLSRIDPHLVPGVVT